MKNILKFQKKNKNIPEKTSRKSRKQNKTADKTPCLEITKNSKK